LKLQLLLNELQNLQSQQGVVSLLLNSEFEVFDFFGHDLLLLIACQWFNDLRQYQIEKPEVF